MAQTWKQPKCPSTDEWIRKSGVYIQWTITQPQKDEIMPFGVTSMDLEMIIQRKMNIG